MTSCKIPENKPIIIIIIIIRRVSRDYSRWKNYSSPKTHFKFSAGNTKLEIKEKQNGRSQKLDLNPTCGF